MRALTQCARTYNACYSVKSVVNTLGGIKWPPKQRHRHIVRNLQETWHLITPLWPA